MASSSDNTMSATPAHDDMQDALMPGLAPNREALPNEIKVEDNQDDSDNRASDLDYEVSASDSGESGEDSEGNDSDSEASDEDTPYEEADLYSGTGPHADYIREGMSELHRWVLGKFYNPEKHESQRVLISSPQQFQGCQDACNQIVHDLLEQFKNVPDNEMVLRILKDAAYSENGDAKRIGFQGVTGSGKSSLINALLNIPGLALADCGQEACTKFPIEYAAALPGQAKRIAVRIQLFDDQICLELLKEQVLIYREETAQAEDEKENAQASEQDESRCDAAVAFLKAMFNDQAPFRSKNAMHEFLGQQSVDAICATLQQWIQRLRKARKIETNEIFFDAATSEDLNAKLEPYIGSLDVESRWYRRGSLWPVIESMKIHVSSTILDSGIILVDAPGISDSNEYRVKIAQASLAHCDRNIVVLSGKRALDDRQSKKYIEEVFKSMNKRMIIVTTHSDTTRDGVAFKTMFRNDGKLIDIQQEKKDILTEIKTTKKSLKKDPMRLQEKLKTLNLRTELIGSVESGRKLELTTVYTQREIQRLCNETLSDKFLGGKNIPFEIHNVSNTIYTKMTAICDCPASSLSPIRFTGIPKLRESIRKIGEEPQITHLQNHIQTGLPNALTNILLWCNPTTSNISSIAEKAIKDGMRNCTIILEDLLKDLNKTAQEHIVRVVQNTMQDWMGKSKKALKPFIAERYKGYSVRVVTVNAFINKHGVHQPKGQPAVNLNALFMDFMLRKLTLVFKDFEKAANKKMHDASVAINASCKALIEKLEKSQAHLVLARNMETLQTKRRAIERAITTTFETASGAFLIDSNNLRRFVINSNQHSCIMNILNPVYESIKTAYPRARGYCRLRQTAFYDYIQSNQAYTVYLHHAKIYCNQTLENFYNTNIKNKINVILQDLRQALEEYCIKPRLPKEELQRRAILNEIVKAKLSLLKGEVLQKFNECTQHTNAPNIGQKRKRSADED